NPCQEGCGSKESLYIMRVREQVSKRSTPCVFLMSAAARDGESGPPTAPAPRASLSVPSAATRSSKAGFKPDAYGSSLVGSSLVRLQFMDVLDDLVDLRVAERRTKRGHRARFTVLDTVAKKVVVTFCIHELWPLARSAATVGVTPPAGRYEQLATLNDALSGAAAEDCGRAGAAHANEAANTVTTPWYNFIGYLLLVSLEIPLLVSKLSFHHHPLRLQDRIGDQADDCGGGDQQRIAHLP